MANRTARGHGTHSIPRVIRSLAMVLALMAWPANGLLNAPVASTLILEAVRAFLLLGVALYYRAAILSA